MTITGGNITIMVRDMDKSVSFYQSIGLTLKTRWGNHYAQVTAPGVVIGLHPTSDSSLTGGSGSASIGFTADNFEDAKALLQRRELRVIELKQEINQLRAQLGLPPRYDRNEAEQ